MRRGETIPLSVFTDGEGGITRGIIEHGGLFNYNVARLQGKVAVPVVTTPVRPMTLAEKIIARHWVTDLPRARSGFPRCARETRDSFAPTFASATNT